VSVYVCVYVYVYVYVYVFVYVYVYVYVYVEGRGLRNFSCLEDPQGFYIKRTLSSVNTFFMLP
jgi:hypothetical protein